MPPTKRGRKSDSDMPGTSKNARNSNTKGVAKKVIAKKPQAVAKKTAAKKKAARGKTAQQDTAKKGSSRKQSTVTVSAKKTIQKAAVAKKTPPKKANAKKAVTKKKVTATKKPITNKRLTKKAPPKKTVKKKVNARKEPVLVPKTPIATIKQQRSLKELLVELNWNALSKTKNKPPNQWMYNAAVFFDGDARTAEEITDIDDLLGYGRGLLATSVVHPIPKMAISMCAECGGVNVDAKPPEEFASFFCASPVPFGVECPICLEQCKLPMVTECGHVFCADCLRVMFETCYKCPICQRLIYPHLCCMLK